MASKKCIIGICFILALLIGCAGVPVREAVRVDLSIPVGKIEGNQFIGIRYPFRVSAPSGWKVTMEIPDFMEALGYERPGLEESQVFIFNPSTQSNLQIDFTPAGPYARFSQESIERLTTMATGGLKEELEKDYGRGVKVEVGPTTPFSLKGVPFAAKKYATYTLKGVKREQGWIYGFSEPYQIFILYMILEKEGTNDHQDLKMILDSFEVTSRK
jgi:hypothetical protein